MVCERVLSGQYLIENYAGRPHVRRHAATSARNHLWRHVVERSFDRDHSHFRRSHINSNAEVSQLRQKLTLLGWVFGKKNILRSDVSVYLSSLVKCIEALEYTPEELEVLV